MKLEKWALIVEIVAGIAVVVSILYLATEVQRNTNAIQSQTQQGLLELAADDNMLVASNGELAEIYVRAQEDISSVSDVERERYKHLIIHGFNIWEQAFLAHGNGTMAEATWMGWDRGYRFLLCSESSVEIFREIEAGYLEFGNHIRRLIARPQENGCSEAAQ
jgi:hypothetical protein